VGGRSVRCAGSLDEQPAMTRPARSSSTADRWVGAVGIAEQAVGADGDGSGVPPSGGRNARWAGRAAEEPADCGPGVVTFV
jgi:hypothetical protein